MRLARVYLALVAALGTILLTAAEAAAQPVEEAVRKLPSRPAKFVRYRGWVAMSVSWRDVVNARIRKKLLSGLPTVVVTRAYVFPVAGAQPVALSAKHCRVVFDLWDEVFHIDLRQGGRQRKTVAVNVEGVLRRCGEARRLPIISYKSVNPGQPHFVGVLVEVNPLSKQMLERIKRWVALPRGAGAVGPGDSLFGSFVGLFITHVPAADETLAYRTQTFIPAKLPIIPHKKK